MVKGVLVGAGDTRQAVGKERSNRTGLDGGQRAGIEFKAIDVISNLSVYYVRCRKRKIWDDI